MQVVFLPSEQTLDNFPALNINISEFSDSVPNHFVPIGRKNARQFSSGEKCSDSFMLYFFHN